MWTFTIAGSTGIMWSGDFDETNYYNDYFVFSYVFIFFCIFVNNVDEFLFFQLRSCGGQDFSDSDQGGAYASCWWVDHMIIWQLW